MTDTLRLLFVAACKSDDLTAWLAYSDALEEEDPESYNDYCSWIRTAVKHGQMIGLKATIQAEEEFLNNQKQFPPMRRSCSFIVKEIEGIRRVRGST